MKIENANKYFRTSLNDKRDDYTFKIVRLPYKSSNIPQKMFISSTVAELLRIARVTSTLTSFSISAKSEIQRMITQGAQIPPLKSATFKIIRRHWEDFEKYSETSRRLLSYIFFLDSERTEIENLIA